MLTFRYGNRKLLSESRNKQFERKEQGEQEPNKLVLSFDTVKEMVLSKIGNKADVVRLDVEETEGGVHLSAELNAGMLGGTILLEGSIVNSENGLVIRNLNVDARGYVKSRIESGLGDFGQALKNYFETKYSQRVIGIRIENDDLVVNFADTIKTEQKSGAPTTEKQSSNKPFFERQIDYIDRIKGTSNENSEISRIGQEYLDKGDLDKAKTIAEKFTDEKIRKKSLAAIARTELRPFTEQPIGKVLAYLDLIDEPEQLNRAITELGQQFLNSKKFDDARAVAQRYTDENVRNKSLAVIDRMKGSH